MRINKTSLRRYVIIFLFNTRRKSVPVIHVVFAEIRNLIIPIKRRIRGCEIYDFRILHTYDY